MSIYNGNLTPTALVLSGTATVKSNPVDANTLEWVSFDIRWTGTPSGTLTIQESDDNVTYYAVNSARITNPSLSSPAGSASSEMLRLQTQGVRYFLVQYVNSTGTGSMTVFCHGFAPA